MAYARIKTGKAGTPKSLAASVLHEDLDDGGAPHGQSAKQAPAPPRSPLARLFGAADHLRPQKAILNRPKRSLNIAAKPRLRNTHSADDFGDQPDIWKISVENETARPMTENLTDKKALGSICGLALASLLCVTTAAEAVEPEKQPIYANVVNGLLCGTSNTNQCKVPAGRRLIIEHVSGFVFAPVSSNQTTVVTMTITDQGLGLHGAGFHITEDDAAPKRHFLFFKRCRYFGFRLPGELYGSMSDYAAMSNEQSSALDTISFTSTIAATKKRAYVVFLVFS